MGADDPFPDEVTAYSVGAVVGIVAGALIMALIGYLCWRKFGRQEDEEAHDLDESRNSTDANQAGRPSVISASMISVNPLGDSNAVPAVVEGDTEDCEEMEEYEEEVEEFVEVKEGGIKSGDDDDALDCTTILIKRKVKKTRPKKKPQQREEHDDEIMSRSEKERLRAAITAVGVANHMNQRRRTMTGKHWRY